MSEKETEPRMGVPVSEAVAEAIVSNYARIQGMDELTVREGFHGGIPFDSILGIELAAAMEEVLMITISEKRLMNSKIYKSLANFGEMIQECVNERQSTEETGSD